MNRRELLGATAAILLLALGRLVRRFLLLDAGGQWREPGWLESHLPPLPDDPLPAASRAPRRPAAPLDPNTCAADSLELLPGIGPALAERIVHARARGVHFACARDLQGIRGIGPRVAAQMEPYLVFDKGVRDSSGIRQSASRGAR